MKCRECGAENASGTIDCGYCGHSLSAESSMTSERTVSSDSMERILLAQAVEIEEGIRGAKGLRGFLARALTLPSTMVFKSEIETVSQHVDKEGRVTVTKGVMPNAKVTFEGSHSSLCQMLADVALERKSPVVESPIRVTVSGWFPADVVFEIRAGEVGTRCLKRSPWDFVR